MRVLLADERRVSAQINFSRFSNRRQREGVAHGIYRFWIESGKRKAAPTRSPF